MESSKKNNYFVQLFNNTSCVKKVLILINLLFLGLILIFLPNVIANLVIHPFTRCFAISICYWIPKVVFIINILYLYYKHYKATFQKKSIIKYLFWLLTLQIGIALWLEFAVYRFDYNKIVYLWDI